ncbi:MAG: replication-relaxation family protein [Romboutsia sp.]|nr:replication-relaxation family protein [Romboutsia sp.]
MSELTRAAQKIITYLKDRDIKILKSIYDLRCLTGEQIFELHFVGHRNQSYCKKRLKFLIDNNVIEERSIGMSSYCYFLKTTGVNIVKYYYSLSDTLYDENKNILRKGCFTAGDLRLKDNLINHQIHLNQFYIDLLSLNTQAYMNYSDSKHFEKYNSIIPDGVLETYGVSFFIEMDMGTEQKKQLNKKWCNYRDFLTSEEFKFSERKIIVLFILDGYGNQDNRKKVIEIEAYNVLNSEVGNDFDIYIGDKNEILDTFKNKIIPVLTRGYINNNEIKNILINKYKYKVTDGFKDEDNKEFIDKFFSGTEYLYIAKENLIADENDNKISTPMSFVVDESFYSPFQSLNKICSFNDTNKSNAKLIIVCDSIEKMFLRLRQVDLLTQKNIYYTTIDRLKNNIYLHNAIVNFDNLGNVYSFSDRELNNIHYETTIKV